MIQEPIPVVPTPIFFIDYDGTIAPIVDDPMLAFPHPEALYLLKQLDARYPLWIITGRHLRDVGLLLNLPLKAVGLHGAQQGRLGKQAESLMDKETVNTLSEMQRSAPIWPGVRVEDKEHTFAVHYREAADEDGAVNALKKWAAGIPANLNVIWGKKVVELRPAGLSKGVAVRRLAEAYPHCTPVCLGDDVTDEDAFEALGPEAVTIKVGEGDTKARFRLPDVEAVIQYLGRYTAPS